MVASFFLLTYADTYSLLGLLGVLAFLVGLLGLGVGLSNTLGTEQE